jgi:hypothetical protein
MLKRADARPTDGRLPHAKSDRHRGATDGGRDRVPFTLQMEEGLFCGALRQPGSAAGCREHGCYQRVSIVQRS